MAKRPNRTRIDQIIEDWSPVLRREFTAAIQGVRDRAQIEQLARMLERGDVSGAVRALGLDPTAFRGLDRAIEQAFEAGGNATAGRLPSFRDPDGLRVVFQFDVRNPVAERWLREQSSTLIRDILDDQRVMIRETLTAGLERGLNPRATALDLAGRVVDGKRTGGLVGLTSSQAGWVRNYEAALRGDNPLQALSRSLRDARFDALVRRYAAAGKAIPPGDIQAMVTAYTNRALRYRAEAIARTETMASVHQAQEESLRQAIESGAIDQNALTFIWRDARDNRVRETHEAMNGQVVRFGELFESPSGARLRYPGDPNAPAAERINCRCWREPKVDFLAAAVDAPDDRPARPPREPTLAAQGVGGPVLRQLERQARSTGSASTIISGEVFEITRVGRPGSTRVQYRHGARYLGRDQAVRLFTDG